MALGAHQAVGASRGCRIALHGMECEDVIDTEAPDTPSHNLSHPDHICASGECRYKNILIPAIIVRGALERACPVLEFIESEPIVLKKHACMLADDYPARVQQCI